MVRLQHWKSLMRAGCTAMLIVGGYSACADSTDPLAPTVQQPTNRGPSNGAPTSESRAVLNCTASLTGGNQPVVTCAPASTGGTSSASGRRMRASDVIVGRQNVDVTVALSNYSYTASTGIFQFDATVKNLLNQPLGTTDGVHATTSQTRIFFYTPPAVTHGVGTVTVHNPDGFGYFTQSAPQPYYQYASPIAAYGTSAPKTWQLAVAGSVTGFTFAVEVDGALPAEKSIRRWVMLREGVTSDSLTSVWMRSPTDVYAVGVGGALLEYNGTTWSSYAVAPAGTNFRAVSGVAGSAVASVWAVGDGGLVERDSGGTWSAVPTNFYGTLYGVWSASTSTAFAVGSSATLLQYTRGAWTTWPAPHGVTSALHAVWGTDSAHVWAAGERGTVLFFNGSTWVQQSSGTTQSLLGLWGDATTDVFAVGAAGTILHYNGTSWSTQPSYSGAQLSGVGGSSASNVWAVGANGTTLRYNGSLWSVVGPHTGIPLSAVTGGSATPWAVGAEGSLLFYDGSRWDVSTQSGLSLNSVWASSANDVWITTLGTVLHYDGSNWTNAYVSPGDSMTGIWGTRGADTIYTVGANGNVAYYLGGTWTSLSLDYQFFALWGTSSLNVYGGTPNGVVVHYTGGGLGSTSLPTTSAVQGIWGSGATNVYAVLANGRAYSYPGSGSAWSAVTLPSGIKNLDAVAGSSASDVYVAGTNGTIAHYAGSGSWTAMTSNTAVTLRGLWADAASTPYTADAYAVGDNGTVQHYNGTVWLGMSTPANTPNLRSIYGTSSTNLYVVGDQGTVLLGTQ